MVAGVNFFWCLWRRAARYRMDGKEFTHFRKRLNKTQKDLAQLCGTSVKAIKGYEQGWRSVPAYIERQLHRELLWVFGESLTTAEEPGFIKVKSMKIPRNKQKR